MKRKNFTEFSLFHFARFKVFSWFSKQTDIFKYFDLLVTNIFPFFRFSDLTPLNMTAKVSVLLIAAVPVCQTLLWLSSLTWVQSTAFFARSSSFFLSLDQGIELPTTILQREHPSFWQHINKRSWVGAKYINRRHISAVDKSASESSRQNKERTL